MAQIIINDVIDKLISVFSSAEGLTDIRKWHKVNGIIPSPLFASGSVGVEEENFEEYTAADDKVNPRILVYIYLQKADPEVGEKEIRTLVHELRWELSLDRTLGNLVSSIYVSKVKYPTVYVSESQILHVAEITLTPEYYEPRTKGA